MKKRIQLGVSILLFCFCGIESYAQQLQTFGQIKTFLWKGQLVSDNNGNFILAGYQTHGLRFIHDGSDEDLVPFSYDQKFFVLKYDAQGNFIWLDSLEMGGGAAFDLATDPNGNILISGNYTEPVDFDPGAAVALKGTNETTFGFVLKLNSNGEFVWCRTTEGSGRVTDHHITSDASGNVISMGTYQDSTDFEEGPLENILMVPSTSEFENDLFVQKISSNGNLMWVKSFGQAEYWDIPIDIHGIGDEIELVALFTDSVDLDPGPGNHTVVDPDQIGYSSYLLRLDSDGEYLASEAFVCSDTGYFEVEKAIWNYDDELFLFGYTKGIAKNAETNAVVSTLQNDSTNVFVLRKNGTAGFSWIHYFPNAVDIYAGTCSNHLFLTGRFSGTVDFDRESGVAEQTFSTTPWANSNRFVATYDQDGTFHSVDQPLGTVSIPWTIAANANNQVSMIESFEDSVAILPFDPQHSILYTEHLETGVTSQAFYIWSDDPFLSLQEYSVYPNPTADFVSVLLEGVCQEVDVKVVDLQGKVVQEKLLKNTDILQLRTSEWNEGIYLLHVTTEKGSFTERILKSQKD